MSIRLYVGNLPKELERQELAALFSEFDESLTTKVITDRKTGKCRGFGFVTVKSEEQADQVIEKFDGFLFKETPLKIERAQPREKAAGEGEGDESTPAAASGSRKKTPAKGGKKPATTTDSESVQPDPRWAQDLEKLKQLLSTQTASS
ncbi:MAG: RNA-binding protein [Cyanobacteria bacterium J069]|nr:MAG: RNA-binding protein [Cyanobacteria bacterium J069]